VDIVFCPGLTHLRHRRADFAVMHKAAFRTVMWYVLALGLRESHEKTRVHRWR
jgi:hypothetical protein